MMNSIKNIVVASNPFGFGPTGTAIPILEELQKRFSADKDVVIYFVGSEKCHRILPEFHGIRKVVLDERNKEHLMNFLRGLDGLRLVIGVQNRFIVDAGRVVGCKTVFFDFLAWMWPEIPKNHLIADEIFWTRFPGIVEKYKKYIGPTPNIHLINGVYKTVVRKNIAHHRAILFCVGGGFNPLRGGIQKNYLLLLSLILKKSKLIFSDVEIIAGDDVANFLKSHLSDITKWRIVTLKHNDMMDRLADASCFVSVGGQSSTMEAILSGVPIIFFIPSNLSQVILQMKIAQEIGGDILWWARELSILLDSPAKYSEKEFIGQMEMISQEVLKDSNRLDVLALQFDDMLSKTHVDSKYFFEFEKLGRWIDSSGAIQIVDSIEDMIIKNPLFSIAAKEGNSHVGQDN